MSAKGDPRNTATKIRDANHQAMRDRLMAYPLVAKVIERIEKLDAGAGSMDGTGVAALKAANDASLRLLAKVLPDLKAVEHSGHVDGSVAHSVDLSKLSPQALREVLSALENARPETDGPG